MAGSPFLIRPSVPSAHDVSFILAAFDSTLPYLSATGNSGMWGTTPFSQKEGFVEDSKKGLATAQHFRETGEGERLLTWIAEVEDEGHGASADQLHRRVDDRGRRLLAVGIMDMRDEEFSDHLLGQDSLKEVVTRAREEGGFAYIDMLATDHRVAAPRRGAGVALVEHAKQYGREHNKKWLYIDCYTGGTDGLVKYYERIGFESIADYGYQRKDGTVWPGRVFRMEL